MNHPVLYPPLEQVTRPHVTTQEAAHYLNRRPQTLRRWASLQTGPLQPIRLYTRLAWPVGELQRLNGLKQKHELLHLERT